MTREEKSQESKRPKSQKRKAEIGKKPLRSLTPLLGGMCPPPHPPTKVEGKRLLGVLEERHGNRRG
jgi:hypothetical protein